MARRRATSSPAVNQPVFPALARGVDLTIHKTIRLAVSGDVGLTRLETRLVDTADFQRLRAIRQLGTACWVYPTALHTRFDHSLGTLAVAVRMIDAIRTHPSAPLDERDIGPDHEQLARLYALLHDITHVPFGHTIEDESCIFPRHDKDPARLDRLLGEGSALGRIVIEHAGRDNHQRLLALMGLGTLAPDDAFIADLVSETICADLLDYLRRDAFFCNISIETDDRFFRHLGLVRHEGRRRLFIRLWKEGKQTPRRDVLNELIRLLDNRYLMAERVYYHHAKLVTGAMLAGAVARAHLSGELSADDLLGLGDDVLLWRLRAARDPAAARLAARLHARALWKPLYERGGAWLRAEQQAVRRLDVADDLMARFHRDAAGRTAAEDRLAALAGLDPGDLLIHCPHLDMAMKFARVPVFWNGALRPLHDCADDPLVGARLQSILDSHRNLWALRVFINPDRADRRDLVAAGLDALFAYEPAHVRRLDHAFIGRVLEEAAALQGLGQALPPAEHARRRQQAETRFLELPPAGRTRDALDRIAGETFAAFPPPAGRLSGKDA